MTRDDLLVADVRRAERALREAQARLLAHRNGPMVSATQGRRQRGIDKRYKFLQDQARVARPD